MMIAIHWVIRCIVFNKRGSFQMSFTCDRNPFLCGHFAQCKTYCVSIRGRKIRVLPKSQRFNIQPNSIQVVGVLFLGDPQTDVFPFGLLQNRQTKWNPLNKKKNKKKKKKQQKSKNTPKQTKQKKKRPSRAEVQLCSLRGVGIHEPRQLGADLAIRAGRQVGKPPGPTPRGGFPRSPQAPPFFLQFKRGAKS